jgi:hypothetical protein
MLAAIDNNVTAKLIILLFDKLIELSFYIDSQERPLGK